MVSACRRAAEAFSFRKPLFASIMPAAAQRRVVEAPRQRFTLRVTRRIMAIAEGEPRDRVRF